LSGKFDQVGSEHNRLLFRHEKPENIWIAAIRSRLGSNALDPEHEVIAGTAVCPPNQGAMALH
jgi:hypothetical protein